jgi:DNA modification methylase
MAARTSTKTGCQRTMTRKPRRWQIKHADCFTALAKLETNSVDTIVTDPPYGISANGMAWDRPAKLNPAGGPGRRRRAGTAPGRSFQDFCKEWASACQRVQKPGAHFVAFVAPRTAHLLACGLEETGLELRDMLMWISGNGFPGGRRLPGGRGVAVRPGYQPILLARKPLEGTLKQNHNTHRTGALNIDACRIGSKKSHCPQEGRTRKLTRKADESGRWPANVIFSHTQTCTPSVCESDCPVAQLGERQRFFYCSRVSRPEREAGCEQLPLRTIQTFKIGPEYERRAKERPVANIHPTVKPIELMRWLIRLTTPPGGLVLDPFAGSGSTGAAAIIEGARFIGIEREAEYVPIARARIKHWARLAERRSQ